MNYGLTMHCGALIVQSSSYKPYMLEEGLHNPCNIITTRSGVAIPNKGSVHHDYVREHMNIYHNLLVQAWTQCAVENWVLLWTALVSRKISFDAV